MFKLSFAYSAGTHKALKITVKCRSAKNADYSYSFRFILTRLTKMQTQENCVEQAHKLTWTIMASHTIKTRWLMCN